MKNFLSAWSVLILGLSITTFLFLAGCGGLNATSPAPTPNPFQPSPTPTSPHGTFVYVNSSANGISKTTGYRLNPDGTLTALAGSPFPISVMAVAGSFLAVTDSNGLSTYLIDAATGALTKAGSATVLRPGAVAADANNVYVSGDLQPEGSGTGIYGFSLAPDGALTPLAGSPTFFDGGCFFCDEPAVLAVNNTFLVQGGVGFHAVGDFTVYPRMAGGILASPKSIGTDAQQRVTIQHPTGQFAYALDVGESKISEFTIDASGKPTPGLSSFTGTVQDLTVDASGKFLLAVDINGVVHVFSIDSATGAFSQIGTSEAAGNGAFGIAIDPSGKFVLVSQSATSTNLPNAQDQITVFTFDSASGAMKKLQSFPQSPGRIVVIASR